MLILEHKFYNWNARTTERGTAMARVLVVDDDVALREMLGMVLAEEGYEVARARHGADAIAQIENGWRPDVILLDLMMPVMDGAAFCEWLRSQMSPSERPAVVLLSAALDFARTLPQVDAALPKPYSLDAVLDLVRRFSDQRALRLPLLPSLPQSLPASL